jgi:hypothetical protein
MIKWPFVIVKNYVAVFCAGEGMHNQEQQC